MNNKNLDSLLSLNSRIEKRLKETAMTKPKPKKEPDTANEWASVLRGLMNISLGKPTGKAIKILVDSGATHSVVDESLCSKLRIKKQPGAYYYVPGKGSSVHLC